MSAASNPAAFDEPMRQHYAVVLCAPRRHTLRLRAVRCVGQDALDNQGFAGARQADHALPVFAVGGEKSDGPKRAADMRFVATNVKAAAVTNAGHRLMEEQPAQTIAFIREFIDPR